MQTPTIVKMCSCEVRLKCKMHIGLVLSIHFFTGALLMSTGCLWMQLNRLTTNQTNEKCDVALRVGALLGPISSRKLNSGLVTNKLQNTKMCF